MKYKGSLLLIVLFLTSCNVLKMRVNSSTRKLRRQEVTSHIYKTDSLSMKYWMGGEGPVIVFVHGFGGDALMAWEKELKHFSKTNTVIAADLLWFGESTSLMAPNLQNQTKALAELLDYLQIDTVSLVGQSYGGFVIIDLAMKNPGKIRNLVVANSPGPTFNIAELDQVCLNYHVNRIDELFVFDDPSGVQRLIDLSTYKDPKIPKFALKQSYEMYFDQNHSQLVELMTTLPLEKSRYTDLSFLKSIPTLVLWGEKDEIFSLPEGKKFSETINAQFVVIPNCGHAPQADAHKKFLGILEGFL